MFEAPLKAVDITLLKSSLTGDPSENLSSFGITVHPRRTPVNPAYLEKELTSMAHSLALGISKMDLGTSGFLINGAYAASNTKILPFLIQNSTSSVSYSFVAAAPVGLFGEQK